MRRNDGPRTREVRWTNGRPSPAPRAPSAMIARAARVEDAEWSLFGLDVTMTSSSRALICANQESSVKQDLGTLDEGDRSHEPT